MDLLDTTSTQRPLLDVLVLFSYPVSLSAAVSVWTWLAVAVAGVWIWRLVSHQHAAVARSKEGPLSSASHLFRPQPTTATCLLLQSPEEEIEPPCSRKEGQYGCTHVPAPVLVDVQEAICAAGTRKTVVYFEGHGGRCRGSSSVSSSVRNHHDQDDDAQDRAVHASHTSTRWCCDDAQSSCVVRYWDDDVARHEPDQQQDRDTTPARDDEYGTNMMVPLDLGFRRFQDWRVINGNVVRLWHASPPHHKHQHQHLLLLQPAAARTGSSAIGPVAVASPLFP